MCIRDSVTAEQSPNRTAISTYGKWGGYQRSAKNTFKLKDLTSDTHTFTNHNQTDNNNYNFGYFIVQHYCGYRSVSTSNTINNQYIYHTLSISNINVVLQYLCMAFDVLKLTQFCRIFLVFLFLTFCYFECYHNCATLETYTYHKGL